MKARHVYQKLSQEMKFTYLDMFHFNDHRCGKDYLKPKCKIDGLHFNQLGNQVWVNNIVSYINNT